MERVRYAVAIYQAYTQMDVYSPRRRRQGIQVLEWKRWLARIFDGRAPAKRWRDSLQNCFHHVRIVSNPELVSRKTAKDRSILADYQLPNRDELSSGT